MAIADTRSQPIWRQLLASLGGVDYRSPQPSISRVTGNGGQLPPDAFSGIDYRASPSLISRVTDPPAPIPQLGVDDPSGWGGPYAPDLGVVDPMNPGGEPQGGAWEATVTPAAAAPARSPAAPARLPGSNQAQPPTPYAATNAPLGAPSFSEWANGLLSNPNLAAGLAILGTQPGGNWGPAGVQAAQTAQRGQMQQAEFKRLQAQRAQQQRIWQEAFPGGSANPNHPLTKGMPPELLASVYAMGPEQGLGLLGKYAMANSTTRMEMQQRMALERMKMDLANQQRQAQMQGLEGMFNRLRGAGAPGQATAPAAPAGQPDPFAAPATVITGDETTMAPVAAPVMAPQPAGVPSPAPATAAQPGPSIMDTPGVAESMFGSLYLGDPKGAFDAFNKEVERRRAPQVEADKKRAVGQVELEANRPQARASAVSALDSLGRMEAEARAIYDDPGLAGITGLYGQLPDMSGSAASDTRARLKSLVSQIGFSTLQAMREASKTGGALGNVSERELEGLQNAIAGLDTKQSPESFRRALMQVMDYSRKTRERMAGAYRETYGEELKVPKPTVYQTRPETKKLGKKTYIKIDGQWFEQ